VEYAAIVLFHVIKLPEIVALSPIADGVSVMRHPKTPATLRIKISFARGKCG